ncbi:PEP/pyruvate-binding domain-containing protein [Sebaldella sp. S0638]|uniref:PEP/pyruvate-binding domain-containing protein n=1 Tax=Sebaldella sp. S0638 TaxID=2957809 RepID=UPI00209FECED|nr:PEP/pyruvate-binding domain-containing protein [Sebaldella sp. S0638]MCP1222932.1 PEP-utilizing enzyme [Sebaldella sp. S0638]
MKKYIVNRENYHSFQNTGGKIKGLFELEEYGFTVPEWFGVSPEIFYDNIEEDITSFSDKSEIIKLTDKFQFGENSIQILDAAEKLGAAEYYAVRSSARAEDSEKFSFAGQLESFLYVKKEDIEIYIKKVWKSMFADHIYEYGKNNNIDIKYELPFVIVQKMINSESAGVAFSKNPVNGNNEAVISAVYGLGSSLVNGEISGDTYIVSLENNEILSKQINEKEIMRVLDNKNGSGIINVETDIDKRNGQVLNDDYIKKIALIVKKAEEKSGSPRDIEWGIENGEIYILQSRPVTTLGKNRKKEREIIWDNSNIVESYSGITLPLTFSFVRSVYSKVYEQFSLLMGVDKKTIRDYLPVFNCMLGYLNSRIYYNLLNWYKLLTLFPGFKANRKFMEQMMGVKEELPEEVEKSIKETGSIGRFFSRVTLVRTFLGFGINFIFIDVKVKRFKKLLNNTLENRNTGEMSEYELYNYYTELENKLLYNWQTPILNDFYTMISFGVLKNRIQKYKLDTEDGILHNELIVHETEIMSVEPSKYIEKMADIVRDEGIINNAADIKNFENKVFESEKFRKIFDEYMERFGDRSIAELKLESPTLHENPELLLKTVFETAKSEKREKNDSLAELKDKEKEVFDKLKSNIIKKYRFKRTLRLARKHTALRENLRYERTRVYGKVRRIFLRMGELFQEKRIIDNKGDIFYLEKDEIFSLINGTSTFPDMKKTVELRKIKLGEDRKKDRLPDRFKTFGVISDDFEYISLDKDDNLNTDIRKGTGCCKGIVRGKVQVVMNPNETVIEKGSIIVAHSTDPGWVMVFPLAKGLIVEKGSLLSHSAIVARELGIPAVVGVNKVTDWLKDGDIVELDGSTGVIKKAEV